VYINVTGRARPGVNGNGDDPVTTSTRTHHGSTGVKAFVTAGIVLWFSSVAAASAAGLFQRSPGDLPRPTLLAVVVPIVVFLLLYRSSTAFRDFVLSADLRLVTLLQAWRVAGFVFIALYAHNLLPGLFAWPAGLGDIAIGASAPVVVLALLDRPGFAASRGFVVWHLLGIFDFVVAVGTGTLGSGAIAGIVAEVTTEPMGVLPLSLIPGFLVPLFTMLHLTAIFQARRLAARTPA
jgi:hypothetical protein